MLNKRADKLELLRIIEAVVRKFVDKELIINSMELHSKSSKVKIWTGK